MGFDADGNKIVTAGSGKAKRERNRRRNEAEHAVNISCGGVSERTSRRAEDPEVMRRAKIAQDRRDKQARLAEASRRAEAAAAATKLMTGHDKFPGVSGLELQFWPEPSTRRTLTGYGA